ncbi:MAG: hypothetical protein JO018_07805, partial [Candidatus Eremiobacteraeota bacterium]|nr:hypothetical protein [Candidatus Eremiobacteraeota bacterium]
MRLFLSRFTLSSVAALALAGLIAGCSGGSSSLPGSTSATSGATNGSSTASMMLSKLQQQIATHNFTKAPASLVVHHMTQSEVTQKLAALGVVKGQTHVHQGSNAVDLPGGFGFVTTTSPPGPYSGIFAQLAAYRALTASPGIPVFTFGIQPGPPPVAASVSTDVMEALVAPGGGCYIPAVEFVTTEY